MRLLMIALGGALGTSMRYGLTVSLASVWPSWPAGTFAANVLGSLLLGVVAEAFSGATLGGVDVRLVVGVGVLGGFTTYSSFNLETLRLAEQGEWTRAGLYLAGTVLACVLAGLLGLWLGGRLAAAG